MQELKFADCVVDWSRCKITNQAQTLSIEPKVMAVLEILWRAEGQVVSQQDIFAAVWPNSIFSPSSVQRSIAILRKAIEQNTKQPKFILTHPKRGYSLVLPDQTETKPAIKTVWVFAILGLLILAGIADKQFFSAPAEKTTFSLLRPLTSSESSEFELALSPNSDLAAFVRIDGGKKNHIWVKNVVSGKEQKISLEAANYRHLGWAKDTHTLAYIKRTEKSDELWYMAIDPISLTALPAVKLTNLAVNSVLSFQLQWSSTGQIYFAQKGPDDITWLQQYSIAHNRLKTLKTFQGKTQLVTLALSPNEQNLALAIYIHQNKNQIALMATDTLAITEVAVVEGKLHGLSWHPNNQSLLLSNREHLQRLTLDQQLENIEFDNFQYIRNASYTHSGEEILLELISLDVDILSSSRQAPYVYQVLVDTQSLDFLPILSPQQDNFAFESHRNGLKQIFVYDNGQQRLVFNNPDNHELWGIVWSPDGKQIITASKNALFVIDVASATFEQINHSLGPFYLRQWYQHEQALLVSLVNERGIKPAKFDLATRQLTVLFDADVNFTCTFMALDQQDQLYLSNTEQIFQVSPTADMELVWATQAGEITGFTLGDNQFHVGLSYQNEFELLNIEQPSLGATSLFKTSHEQGLHFTNTTKGAEQFYFSQVEDIKKLVRLK
ncbi:winged helix-turn-helix domain-containing protein [Paraglaciecola aestuariivivens]